jgi:hypothetical protein
MYDLFPNNVRYIADEDAVAFNLWGILINHLNVKNQVRVVGSLS